ncbi:hypothetical protein CDAR_313041 [Caerostris darwini]|uniref:Uncharacterized protein n=1 Tax=Caerostris darwini TaxID=1538125 RepID=A0AAV4S211_9ARAC|nr:hypothetical protein CDAR_313041 [Caerostris darwini]
MYSPLFTNPFSQCLKNRSAKHSVLGKFHTLLTTIRYGARLIAGAITPDVSEEFILSSPNGQQSKSSNDSPVRHNSRQIVTLLSVCCDLRSRF